MLTVAVIPARGRSRGLPGKHLRLIGGVPMIVHTIRAATAARRIDRVVVSTDDQRIAEVARRSGAEVPFIRPADLAADDAPTLPVIEHAVRALESKGERISVIVTLQPTSPLRTADQIDAAIALLAGEAVRSVVAVASLHLPASVIGAVLNGRFRSIPLSTETDRRRQAAPSAVRITGAIYVTTRGLLAEGRLLDDAPAALMTDGPAAIDVDELRDLRAARRALAARSR